MAQRACHRCRGTGWANAARDSGMEDAPLLHRPLGVYQCGTCGGTGKLGVPDFTPEELERFRLNLIKVMDGYSDGKSDAHGAQVFELSRIA